MRVVSSKAMPDDEVMLVTGAEGGGPIQVNGRNIPDSVLEAFRQPRMNFEPLEFDRVVDPRIADSADAMRKLMEGYEMDTSDMELKAITQIQNNVVKDLMVEIREYLDEKFSEFKYTGRMLNPRVVGKSPVLVILDSGEIIVGELGKTTGSSAVIFIKKEISNNRDCVEINFNYVKFVKTLQDDEYRVVKNRFCLTDEGRECLPEMVATTNTVPKETLDLGE